MKIQCDVCNRDEASVFCSADEAALCDGCDRRVHHANKLASKHKRFSLLHPSSSPSDAPRCDICQEKRAFLFCREDRAILCRDCDLSIHTANELTKKHNRFLLTGVKLSSTSAIFSSPNTTSTTTTITSSSDSKTTMTVTTKTRPSNVSPVPGLHYPPPSIQTNTTSSSTPSKICDPFDQTITTSVGGSTSSISEYLMETLPGWQVEDLLLLDSSSSSPTTITTHGHHNGLCKNEDLLPFLDADFHLDQTSNLGCFVSEAPIRAPYNPPPPIDNRKNNGLMFKEQVNMMSNPIKSSSKGINKRRSDHGFTVPQISPPSNKRSRPLW
ncbi:zinc finger protein [Macleaya cordata]|uniref:Zinc finger protein n=1 Tax=Macleaya cordata TaxID=56857 RepID=A0A200RCE6_MACCD|nr:zinc finger protein [Macleaya cordata]